MNAIGASATLMIGSDAYLAAQTGVVDAIMGAWGWTNIWKLYEVAPYHVLIGISPGVASYAMRTETFNKFTAEEQELLLDYWRGPALLREWRGNVWEVEVVKSLIPTENYIVWSQEDMQAVRAEFRPMWDEWAYDMESLGYPGYDILDYAVKWIDLYNYA
jgi:TRAP-type C4-dicarboxylate transport system substrate-binding protein